jgi:hypothetical protein
VSAQGRPLTKPKESDEMDQENLLDEGGATRLTVDTVDADAPA